jgi:hypothetical protein
MKDRRTEGGSAASVNVNSFGSFGLRAFASSLFLSSFIIPPLSPK